MIEMALLIAALLFAPLAAHAADEITGFRDVPWGASPASVHEQIGLDCGGQVGPKRSCSATVKIGDVWADRMYFHFRRNGMVCWSMWTGAALYVLKALEEKYGRPTAQDSSRALWRGREAVVTFVYFGSGAKIEAFTLAEIAVRAAESAEEERAATKKSAKDF